MLRLKRFWPVFTLLAAVSPVIVTTANSSAPETGVRDPDAPSSEQHETAPRGAEDQAGPAIGRTAPEDRAGSAIGRTETDEQATGAGPGTAETADTEPLNPVPEEAGPAETEPLIPIETQSSIRVNANVNLPQDI